MKRSLYHTYQMNLGTSCLLNRTIPKNLSTKWGALQISTSLETRKKAVADATAFFMYRGEYRTRTCDPLRVMQMLYQLS